uniref:BTB_3 domain-containing protein n=1 Tax=Rhabditophanes sp. KR3021 TaxID=114890 RepID=A0AC35U9N8_9BILA
MKQACRNTRSMSLGGSLTFNQDSVPLSSEESTTQDSYRTIILSKGVYGEHIIFDINNVGFVVDASLILNKGRTMLATYFTFNNKNILDVDAIENQAEYCKLLKQMNGKVFKISADFSTACFECILSYYHHDRPLVPKEVNMKEFKEACDYFMIPFDISSINFTNLCDVLHELSNEGAKESFDKLLQDTITPIMIEKAKTGARELHLVILYDEDMVEWDPNYPPNCMQENVTITYCTALNKFFSYAENRDVAKSMLQERQLKDIRLGMEGFPIHKERVKKTHSPVSEISYHFVQRPFFHVSWEMKAGISRHVDFACPPVRSKSNPALARLEPKLPGQANPEQFDEFYN